MKATPTAIEGVLVIEPKVFGDARGFFFESYNEQAFVAATGQRVAFVQDNHSRSARGVLRGLHWQEPPHAQGKLVRVTSGVVFDVAVDIRPGAGDRLARSRHDAARLGQGRGRNVFRFLAGRLTRPRQSSDCWRASRHDAASSFMQASIHSSRNGTAPCSADSRMRPENSTLAR